MINFNLTRVLGNCLKKIKQKKVSWIDFIQQGILNYTYPKMEKINLKIVDEVSIKEYWDLKIRPDVDFNTTFLIMLST